MDENAVAFAKAGNAKLNKISTEINDGAQTLKMHSAGLTIIART
jgi:hypothetical protein